MRGLEEKIWKVLAPNPDAFRAACSSEAAMEVWIPMRRLLMVASMFRGWL